MVGSVNTHSRPDRGICKQFGHFKLYEMPESALKGQGVRRKWQERTI